MVIAVWVRVPSLAPKKAVPTGGGLFWCLRWDAKGRPEHSEGKKHAGGMFFRQWESPLPKKKIKEWGAFCRIELIHKAAFED